MKSKPGATGLVVCLVLAIFWLHGPLAASPDAGRVGTRPRSPQELSERDVLRPASARPHDRGQARFPEELRSFNGSGNNGEHPRWGAAGALMLRLVEADYADGRSEPSGATRPNPRAISNVCMDQGRPKPNRRRASSFVWQWGQFLDHDLALTPIAHPIEPFDIDVPAGDPWFDPQAEGGHTIPLERSAWRMRGGVRQQVNAITAFIDASNVYGSTKRRARALRTLDGTGRLKTSAGDLLPFNSRGLPNAPDDSPEYFLAGDFRANEQAGLTALHTLFLREHNYWADSFREADPGLTDEEIYQYARSLVAAEMQAITYREFLPMLLGSRALAPYRGYDPEVNPGISNVFATAAYRVGHTMLSSLLLRLDADGQTVPEGHLPLAEAFFRPELIVEGGVEPLLRGFASQRAQAVDVYVVDAVRNFLFGRPGAGGFDLASLNIQRGRDHGLPGYNQARIAFGLAPVASFDEVSPKPVIQAQLEEAYGSVDELDIWVGSLAERHVRGALVGETLRAILVDQFERLRDGDRFWYQEYLPPDMVRLVERQKLSRIVRRCSAIGSELQSNVFKVRSR